MSQNFELLSQLEAEFHLANAIPKVAPALAEPVTRASVAEFPRELLALAQAVFLSGHQDAPHEVMFCGIDRSNASTTICLALGQVLAANNANVCLIDANVSSPQLAQLADARGPGSMPDPDRCTTLGPCLWLADLGTHGEVRSPALGNAEDLRQRIADLKQRFDFILVDAPDANAGGDALMLGQVVDGVILVIEANCTRKAAARRAKETFQALNVPILGSILNNRTFPIPEKLYHKL